MEHTRPLADLRGTDAGDVGGKSAALGELHAAEIPVPPGFAVGTSAFRSFVAEAGLAPAIDGALGRVDPADVGSVGAAARSIGEAMRSAALPRVLRDEIARRYADLGEPPVAVRSSALGEDSAEATFAGQQETYLWIRGADRVCDAVRDCWVSLYGAAAIAYRARFGSAGAAAMGVVVQEMVDARVSGVLFTCNPVSGDRSMVSVNASWGLGLAVVGGEVTPDDYLVSKVTGEVVREQVHTKPVQYVPGDDGAVLVDVAEELRDTACLDAAALAELVELARRTERHFGSPQDVEWAIDREGTLHVLQSRPVTALPERAAAPAAASAIDAVLGAFGAAKR